LVEPDVAEALQIIIGGLLQGSVYAIVALGFALVYRVTGVINLTQGAFCVFGALCTTSLQQDFGWPLPLAIAGGLVLTTLYGLLLGALFFVPALQRLPQSGMLMLTVGLLTLTQGLMLLIWGGDPYTLPAFSGEAPIKFLGFNISSQGIWILCAALLIIVVFWYLFARTTFGKALQSCAENPMAARLMGIDVPGMAILTFGLTALIGAAGGIVLAPTLSIQFDSGNLFTLMGFIAVAIGGVGSFVGAVVGGLALGVLKQLAAAYVSSLFSDAVALLLLLAILLVKPSGLFALGRPRRTDVREHQPIQPPIIRLHGPRARIVGASGLLLLLVLPWIVTNPEWLGALNLTGILFIGVMGLNVLMGYGGQVSLGHGGFMAIGGYVAAVLATTYGWPPLASTLVALVASVAASLALAGATMRLRGAYLALATLAFGLVVDSLTVGMMGTTGGPSGLVGIPRFSIGGFVFDTDWSMYHLVLFINVVVFMLLHAGMGRSFGRSLMAIRADPTAAAALGINVPAVKLTAFAISAIFASLAGSLYAFYFQFLSPEMVSMRRSFEMVTMIVIGGQGTLIGPIIGVALLTVLPTLFQPLAFYKTFAEGALLVLTFRFLPGGVLGGMVMMLAGLRRLLPRESVLSSIRANGRQT
jgi:branched-chain amino acid transport system permease protein